MIKNYTSINQLDNKCLHLWYFYIYFKFQTPSIRPDIITFTRNLWNVSIGIFWFRIRKNCSLTNTSKWRTQELECLAHRFCAVSVCSKLIDKNQIIMTQMKFAMCNIHTNHYCSKYFLYNNSYFILFHCDFTYNLTYDIMSADVIFRFWVTSQ